MHAVSFQKGCYLGQEIVERIRARGQVHRKLVKLEYARGGTAGGADHERGVVAGRGEDGGAGVRARIRHARMKLIR